MQQLALQQNLQMEMTPLNMYNMFIERIRRNLHVVLAFSPIGDNFRNRIRMFPSLINCCTIDWFKVTMGDSFRNRIIMFPSMINCCTLNCSR
jgi:dynein heavy chain